MEMLICCAALILFAYGLLSARLDRTPVTAPMIFVVVGLMLGPLGLDLFVVKMSSEFVQFIATITLVLILFSDASTIDLKRLSREYWIPVRLLGIGLPLTMLLGFCIAVPLFPGVNWWLIAAMAFILSPTDAALGQAVVSSDEVPLKVRDSIGVESGLNDGITLPAIMACMAGLVATSAEDMDVGYWFTFGVKQILYGPLVGAAVGWCGGVLIDDSVKRNWMEPVFQRLASIALAIIAYSVSEQLGGNGFIAAFFGGLLLGTRTPSVRERIQEFGEAEGQQLCLLVFFIFGMVIVPAVHGYWDWPVLCYALLSLTVIRMVPVALSLLGSKLDWVTIGFIGWFGPRGIASILYLLIFLAEVGGRGHERMLSVIVLTVLLSVFAHGLSAVPLSKRYGAFCQRS
jgi:NhaP-type Na+/H+ or K+/H+ antiporter